MRKKREREREKKKTNSFLFCFFLCNIGRMYGDGKGISGSATPYKRTPPSWLNVQPETVEEQIIKQMNAKSNIIKILSLIAIAFAFNACQENVEPFPENENGRLKISNDALTLSDRVNYKGESVDLNRVYSNSTLSAASNGVKNDIENPES